MSLKNQSLYSAEITAIAGNGGNGHSSFIRNAFIAKGGPDGGNGGHGGSVYIRGRTNITTLSEFKYKKNWKAENGSDGCSFNKMGKRGLDEVIDVPLGTAVFDKDMKILDILIPDLPYLVAQGGAGGYGNKYFATPQLTTPYVSTKGDIGQIVELSLVLKYIANVGVIGMPNAGKSTFVGKISRAKVKIADYDFSTIDPVIGSFDHNGIKITIADLPGLVKGASEGRGLGHIFLQHLERCKILVHFIDISDNEFLQNFETIREEIAKYNPDLLNKKYLICLNKVDLIEPEIANQKLLEMQNKGYECYLLSEYRDEYISTFLDNLAMIISNQI